MTKFKVGDRVEVRVGHLQDGLTYKTVYTITSIGGDYEPLVNLEDHNISYYASRFKLVQQEKTKSCRFKEGDIVKLKERALYLSLDTHYTVLQVDGADIELVDDYNERTWFNYASFVKVKPHIHVQQKSNTVKQIKHGIKITVEKDGEIYTIEL